MKRLIWVWLLLIFLAGCDAGEVFPAPEETLTAFIGYWNDGQYQNMYSLLSSDSAERVGTERFESRYSNISSGIGLTAITLGDLDVEEVEQGSVIVTYTLHFASATVPEFSLDYTATLHRGEAFWELDWDHELIIPGLTEEKTVRVRRHFPSRGQIVDRNHEPLAFEGTLREIGVVPGRIEDEDALVAGLATLLDISDQRVRSLLTQSWVRPEHFVPIKQISEAEWQLKQGHLLGLKGVLVNRAEGRTYAITQAVAQTVGYMSDISPQQLETLYEMGYRSGDKVGASGLEARFEEHLAGTIGFTISLLDENNNATETIAQKEMIDGEDLILSLDLRLTAVADAALPIPGSVVLLDAPSGEILALASKPGFDSNLFAQGISREQYQQLQEQNSPFINRALAALYPPGSVFKPFTALMALQAGVFNPEAGWDTPKQWQPDPSWGGYRITRVDRPSGPVNLLQGMKWSDNVYFADLSLKLGWDDWLMQSKRFGFGEEMPLVLPVKTSSVHTSQKRDPLLADSGYGQGELQATPLHMALMYAALARGDGVLPVPRLLSGEEPKPWKETGMDTEHLARVDLALQAAVADPDAVAFLGIDNPALRGKTGTAQISAGRNIAWFACYFERTVLVVTLEGDHTLTSRQALEVGKTLLRYF